jgi:glycosyltransferase involved in cell wall biosynthesis
MQNLHNPVIDISIIYENGKLLNTKLVQNPKWLWSGYIYSEVGSNGNIINYITKHIHNFKNVILVIPISDGYDDIIGFNGFDGSYMHELYDYAVSNNKVFIVGILGRSNIRDNCKYNFLYLPIDDTLFETNICDYFNQVHDINKNNFEDKSDVLLWRGGYSNVLRHEFVKKMNTIKFNQPVDVKLLNLYCQGKNVSDDLIGLFINSKKFRENKIFFIIDGAVISSNYMWGFASGCVPVLITQSKAWFSEIIKPGFHYVNVNPDLSDLEEKINWIYDNPRESQKIIDNALNLCKTYFSPFFQKNYILNNIYFLSKSTNNKLLKSVTKEKLHSVPHAGPEPEPEPEHVVPLAELELKPEPEPEVYVDPMEIILVSNDEGSRENILLNVYEIPQKEKVEPNITIVKNDERLVIGSKDGNPTICLNMIVKNESKIIVRLLDSVISIIDCYCIVDTGSTDNTVQLIKEYFINKNIPGKVINDIFINFSESRNNALNHAFNLSNSDFILLLDADMQLQINEKFTKNKLNTADTFVILQGSSEFYYQNTRIVKNNGMFEYMGVTHEYINNKSPYVKTGEFNKDELFINDIGDGGSKSDKFERDIKLLLDGILKEPDNVRYYFYLANSYHDSGKYDEAIVYYKKRIEKGGWIQEIWYSHYRIGFCYYHLGEKEKSISSWLYAYECYPERIENLYEIIKYYREIGKQKLSLLFYEKAKNVLLKNKNNTSGFLFLEDHIYKYNLDYEYIIIAFYNDIKNINNALYSIFNYCKNDNIINHSIDILQYYSNTLTHLQRYDFTKKIQHNINQKNKQPMIFELLEKKLGLKEHFEIVDEHNNIITDKNINNTAMEFIKSNLKNAELNVIFYASSGSIIPNKTGGYHMNIRYVNYLIDKTNGSYNIPNTDGLSNSQIITLNEYVLLDENFNPIKRNYLHLNYSDRLYINIEDVRLFYDELNDKILYIGSSYHKVNKIGISVGDYNYNVLSENDIIPDFADEYCEKNWVYFNYKNDISIIYSWYPLTICKIYDNTNVIEHGDPTKLLKKQSTHNNVPHFFSKLRGSTCGFNYKNEIWFITHIVKYGNPRSYYHVILVFDDDMKLKRYTTPFKFMSENIEYCLSIIVEDERIICSHSSWDNTSFISVYDKKYIETQLFMFEV